MEKEYFYIYCKGILGVKTNIRNFKWIYGSMAPCGTKEEYEKCLVKFDICQKPEKQLTQLNLCNKKFQAYSWNNDNKTICYRRKLPLNIEIGYNISICRNDITVEIGKNYYTFIKNRTMNLHGMYYLLSDVANIVLLKNGLITLYASAIFYEPFKKGIVNFAAPNTGKTFTATRLCAMEGYSLVGEDIVICDGYKAYSCPWTCSYRKNNNLSDSAGSFGRVNQSHQIKFNDECDITDLLIFSIGNKTFEKKAESNLRYISILNGYLFNYYSSPIVKILGYFDESYYMNWNTYADEILENLIKQCECRLLQSDKSEEFPTKLHEIVSGEKV